MVEIPDTRLDHKPVTFVLCRKHKSDSDKVTPLFDVPLHLHCQNVLFLDDFYSVIAVVHYTYTCLY